MAIETYKGYENLGWVLERLIQIIKDAGYEEYTEYILDTAYDDYAELDIADFTQDSFVRVKVNFRSTLLDCVELHHSKGMEIMNLRELVLITLLLVKRKLELKYINHLFISYPSDYTKTRIYLKFFRRLFYDIKHPTEKIEKVKSFDNSDAVSRKEYDELTEKMNRYLTECDKWKKSSEVWESKYIELCNQFYKLKDKYSQLDEQNNTNEGLLKETQEQLNSKLMISDEAVKEIIGNCIKSGITKGEERFSFLRELTRIFTPEQMESIDYSHMIFREANYAEKPATITHRTYNINKTETVNNMKDCSVNQGELNNNYLPE